MNIVKYTPKLQLTLKSKTEPKPWLHCILIQDKSKYDYAIYVWDTRQILETGTCKWFLPINYAIDNQTVLKGQNANKFNKDLKLYNISDNQRNKLKWDHEYIYTEQCQVICAIPKSYGVGRDSINRPQSKTVHCMGRTFLVNYYHDGGVQTVNEINN